MGEALGVGYFFDSFRSNPTLLTPDQLNIPADKFKAQFGLEWADVLKDGKALNATAACAKFGVDADGLAAMWNQAKKDKNLVKLGGGFYCGKLEKDGVGPFYVFNAFFMTMRSGFVKPGTSIYYYVVEWDPDDLPWEDFRGKVLGPTDPADAPADSLRGGALAAWEELGLPSAPNTSDNCVHASASPFEGLCEKMNWLGYEADRDKWGKALLDAGVKPKIIKEWSLDPVVTYGAKLNPTEKSIWDTLEDMDAKECIDKCYEISEWRPLKKPKFGKVGKMKPEQTGLNYYVKWVKEVEAVDGGDIKEVLVGDDTGCVVASLRLEEHIALCKVGAMIRIQNAHVRMVKGHIRLVVDKWCAFKAAESVDFEKVDEDDKKNVSSVEYELK